MLDFPPIGYRDANNEPAGYDVDYCSDLAAALEVDKEIIPVTWAERLPVIVTNRADVVFGGTSDSLARFFVSATFVITVLLKNLTCVSILEKLTLHICQE